MIAGCFSARGGALTGGNPVWLRLRQPGYLTVGSSSRGVLTNSNRLPRVWKSCM